MVQENVPYLFIFLLKGILIGSVLTGFSFEYLPTYFPELILVVQCCNVIKNVYMTNDVPMCSMIYWRSGMCRRSSRMEIRSDWLCSFISQSYAYENVFPPSRCGQTNFEYALYGIF